MTATTISTHNWQFTLTGTCPHCGNGSVFTIAPGGGPVQTQINSVVECRAVMQCQGCLKFILGWVDKPSNNTSMFVYREHCPVGKPNDKVPPEIPEHIGADFQEALRCRFVDAYNATVEMCRRAVQAACLEKQAPDGKLVTQIDELAAQGIITEPLKQMAHRVRLGGNLGAHPPEDPDDPTEISINAEYADAVIEFTREFFQHVYVMPERLKKYTFRKSAVPSTSG